MSNATLTAKFPAWCTALGLVLGTLGAQQSAGLPFPLLADGQDLDGHLVYRADAALLERLSGLQAVQLANVPLGSATVVLELQRVALCTRDAALWIDGAPQAASQAALQGDLSLWQGRVVGEQDSLAFFGFSRFGSRGFVRQGSTLEHLVCAAGENGWQDARMRLLSDQELARIAPPPQVCSGALLPPTKPAQVQPRPAPVALPASSSAFGPQSQGGSLGLGAPPLLECRLALETDWQYYQLFGNLDAARTYALTLLGAISARYREQLGVVITLPYLGLYTSNNDPWLLQDQGYGSVDVLYDFQGQWSQGWPVDADLAHLVSGAGLGGGVAWLDTLCTADYGYGVSGNLAGLTPFPISVGTLNWDFMVLAHEIGHNFNAVHTHDYCPPADECAPAGYFGACQTNQVCITDGSIMSYCHLCPGGIANITTYLHPFSVADMRARAENSCLVPFEGALAAPLGNALAGSTGTPTMNASFAQQGFGPGASLTYDFTQVPAPTTGFLITGGQQVNLPLLGGVLVPTPEIVTTFSAPTAAFALPPFALSGSFPLGATLVQQSWFLDLGSPNFLSATEGLALEVIVPNAPTALTWVKHPSNGKEYALGSFGTWFHADGEARTYGAQLVTLSDSALESFLRVKFFDTALAQGSVWIGLSDQFHEGSFQWSSGAAPGYTNWSPGEPNDFNGFEDVAEWYGYGSWNDLDGYGSLRGLLERPAQP